MPGGRRPAGRRAWSPVALGLIAVLLPVTGTVAHRAPAAAAVTEEPEGRYRDLLVVRHVTRQ